MTICQTKTEDINKAKNKCGLIQAIYDVLTFGKHDALCPEIIQQEARKGKTMTTQTSLMGWITVWSLPLMVFRLFEYFYIPTSAGRSTSGNPLIRYFDDLDLVPYNI
ncbi:hypothetical protein CRM22_010873 [Opisthorchis felineus]|uniref:Uncharacterized protein n=1 Tax=Opisthorchis felineus TaxID=147828 RepID=A0A4S2KK64_OPIFE|nr:hypothetical protein CRM22_010873 [Opisthorchis felineus]